MHSNPPVDASIEASDAALDVSDTDDQDAPSDGGAACYVDASGPESLSEYESPATGTLRGQGIDGIVCWGGTGAYMQHIVPQGIQQQDYTLFFVETTPLAPDGTGPQAIQFTTPARVIGASISIRIGLVPLFGPPMPGTYASTDASCGNLDVSLTFPANVREDYEAAASHDCSILESQTPIGSWTLEITSVTDWDDGGPGSYYVVHGSLVVALSGSMPGQGTATLSLAF